MEVKNYVCYVKFPCLLCALKPYGRETENRLKGLASWMVNQTSLSADKVSVHVLLFNSYLIYCTPLPVKSYF